MPLEGDAPANAQLQGLPPVGSILPYSGSGDPATGNGEWVVADGRLIDRTTYGNFFGVIGHSYNGGVDPGNNKVRVPDKRGKMSAGALNMGTGAQTSDNAHAGYIRGASGGEVNHVTTSAEMPGHSHTVVGNTGSDSNDHQHSYLGTTNSNYADGLDRHAPVVSTPGSAGAGTANLGPQVAVPVASGAWQDSGLQHTHDFGGTVTNESATHTHFLSFNSGTVGSGAGHNNLPPHEGDTFIVRIA